MKWRDEARLQIWRMEIQPEGYHLDVTFHGYLSQTVSDAVQNFKDVVKDILVAEASPGAPVLHLRSAYLYYLEESGLARLKLGDEAGPEFDAYAVKIAKRFRTGVRREEDYKT
jgi:hypothetical protein